MAEAQALECEQRILKHLADAGAKGLTKTQLKLPASNSEKGKACREVLKRLERQGQIGNLGSKDRPRFVIAEHFRPLEMACEQIESMAKESGKTLRSKSFFAKGLKGALAKKIDAALKLLVDEGKLLRLRWSSYPVYLHVTALPSHIESPTPTGDESLNEGDVQRAYRETVAEFGYPDVLIHEVYRRLGGDLEAFKTYILRACREGRGVASVGDWSLSSPQEREAALYINGHPHLRIRFEA